MRGDKYYLFGFANCLLWTAGLEYRRSFFIFIYLFIFFLLFCFRLGCEPASRWLVVHAARRKGELLEPGCLGAVEGGAVGGGQAESLAIQNIW